MINKAISLILFLLMVQTIFSSDCASPPILETPYSQILKEPIWQVRRIVSWMQKDPIVYHENLFFYHQQLDEKTISNLFPSKELISEWLKSKKPPWGEIKNGSCFKSIILKNSSERINLNSFPYAISSPNIYKLINAIECITNKKFILSSEAKKIIEKYYDKIKYPLYLEFAKEDSKWIDISFQKLGFKIVSSDKNYKIDALNYEEFENKLKIRTNRNYEEICGQTPFTYLMPYKWLLLYPDYIQKYLSKIPIEWLIEILEKYSPLLIYLCSQNQKLNKIYDYAHKCLQEARFQSLKENERDIYNKNLYYCIRAIILSARCSYYTSKDDTPELNSLLNLSNEVLKDKNNANYKLISKIIYLKNWRFHKVKLIPFTKWFPELALEAFKSFNSHNYQTNILSFSFGENKDFRIWRPGFFPDSYDWWLEKREKFYFTGLHSVRSFYDYHIQDQNIIFHNQAHELLHHNYYPDEIIIPLSKIYNDSDNDGLNDLLEIHIGTNPYKSDSDNDSLDDNIDPFPINSSTKIQTPQDFIIEAILKNFTASAYYSQYSGSYLNTLFYKIFIDWNFNANINIPIGKFFIETIDKSFNDKAFHYYNKAAEIHQALLIAIDYIDYPFILYFRYPFSYKDPDILLMSGNELIPLQ